MVYFFVSTIYLKNVKVNLNVRWKIWLKLHDDKNQNHKDDRV